MISCLLSSMSRSWFLRVQLTVDRFAVGFLRHRSSGLLQTHRKKRCFRLVNIEQSLELNEITNLKNLHGFGVKKLEF